MTTRKLRNNFKRMVAIALCAAMILTMTPMGGLEEAFADDNAASSKISSGITTASDLSTTETTGSELVSNGVFNNATGWKAIANPNSKSGATISIETNPKSSYFTDGSGADYAMELNSYTAQTAYTPISVTPGKTYLLSFDYGKRTKDVAVVTEQIKVTVGKTEDAAGLYTNPTLATSEITAGDFAKQYYSFTVPEDFGGTTAYLAFNVISPTGGSGNILDNVSLKEVAQKDTYVSSTGSDTNAGTVTSPYKTVYKAYSTLASTGTIHIMDTVNITSGTSSRLLMNTSGKNVTITGTYTDKENKEHKKEGVLKRSGTYSPIQIGYGVTENTLTLTDITLQGAGITSATTAPFIYLWGNKSTLNVGSGTTITGVYNNFSSSKGTQLHGGAIYAVGGTVNIKAGSTIKENRAYYGGAIYMAAGTLNIEADSKITENTANSYGGGVYLGATGTLNMTGGEMSENKAAYGTIFTVNGSTLNMSGGSIVSNTVTGSGGGIYSAGVATISGTSLIDSNTANYGGGIYDASNKLALEGGKISNNQVKYQGGGIYVSGANAVVTQTAGVISDNIANGSNGGGVFISYGTYNFNGGEIKDNTANSYGGGVFNSSGQFTMDGATAEITGNTAKIVGGGIYLDSNGKGYLYTGTITGNTVEGSNGGGVYYRGGTFQIGKKLVINNNKDKSGASNLYVYTSAVLSVSDPDEGFSVGYSSPNNAAMGKRFALVNKTGNEYVKGFFLDSNTSLIGTYEASDSRYLIWKYAAQTDVYVSADGDNATGTGTNAKPFATLEYAYANVSNNGTIHVMTNLNMSAANCITVTDNKTITIKGEGSNKSLIRNNHVYRMITVKSGSKVILDNITLDGNNYQQNVSSRSYGQLVYINGGTLEVKANSVLQNNYINHTYTDYGSAIYIDGGGTLDLYGKIINNKLTGNYSDGAAISSIYGANTINLHKDSEISGNTASRIGSAIRLSSGTLTIDGKITGNSYATYGTVYVPNRTGTELIIGPNAEIKDNNAHSNGTKNYNLYLDQNASMSLSGSSYTATGNVILYQNGGKVGSVIATNYISGSEKLFTYYAGGLKVVKSGEKLILGQETDYYVSAEGSDTATGTLADPYKTLNKAYSMLPAEGGTINIIGEVEQTSAANISGNKSFTLKGYDKNAVLKRVKGNTNYFITQTGGTLTIENLILDGNKANNVTAGRALIYVAGDDETKVILGNGAVLQNNNNSTGNNTSYQGGGGVRIERGTFTMNEGSKITGNKSSNEYYSSAGGVMVRPNGTFVMNGGEITGNESGTGYGGAGLYIYLGTAELKGGKITGNTTVSNEGSADVATQSQNLKISGSAQVDKLYLYSGYKFNLASGFTGKLTDVTVADAPAAGKERIITNNDNHNFTSETIKTRIGSSQGHKVVVESQNYVAISNKSVVATLSSVNRTALYGEAGSYTTVSSNGEGLGCAENITIIVPFAQTKTKFTVNAYATDSTATIVTEKVDGKVTPAENGNGRGTVINYDPKGTSANAEYTSYTYTVTAQDGVTKKVYTVTIQRGPVAVSGSLQADVNFDATKELTDYTAVLPLTLGVNTDASSFSVRDEEGNLIETLTCAYDDGTGNLTLRATTEYYNSLLPVPNPIPSDATEDWISQSDSGKYTLTKHVKKLKLYYGQSELCDLTVNTTRATVSEAATVKAVVDKFNAGGAYDDLFQNKDDALKPASSLQVKDVNLEADAESVMALYAIERAKEALDGAYEGNVQAKIDVYGSDGNKIGETTEYQGSANGGTNKPNLVMELKKIAFTEPTAGTATDIAGTDGLYRFKVVVTLGMQSTTNEQSVVIHAAKYNGISKADLNSVLEDAFHKEDGTPKLGGTVYVIAGAENSEIETAIKDKMNTEVLNVIRGLNEPAGEITYAIVDNEITFTYAYGKATATMEVSATKNGSTTKVSITVPLNMEVRYRQAVETLVGPAIETAFNTKVQAVTDFVDVDASVKNKEKDLQQDIEEILGKVIADLNDEKVTVNTSATDEPNPENNIEQVDISNYTLSAQVTGAFNAAVAGTAAAPDGANGQYIFSAKVTVEKDGTELYTFNVQFNASDNPVKAINGGGGADNDNGIYISPVAYDGVSDQIAANIVKELLENANMSTFTLTYEERNNADARLDKIDKWVEETISKANTTITVGGVAYKVENGKVTAKGGKSIDASQQPDLGLAAVGVKLNDAELAKFTTENTAASTENVSNAYTFTVTMAEASASGGTFDKTATFKHDAGIVKGEIAGGTGPFTIILYNKNGNIAKTITTKDDGSYNLPADLDDGEYTAVVHDANNSHAAVGEIKVPSLSTQLSTITLKEGAYVEVTVLESGGVVKDSTILVGGSEATATEIADGKYILTEVKAGDNIRMGATKENGVFTYNGYLDVTIPAKDNKITINTTKTMAVSSDKKVTLQSEDAASGATVVMTANGVTYKGTVDSDGYIQVAGVLADVTSCSITITDALGRTATKTGVEVNNTTGKLVLGEDITIKPDPSKIGEVIGTLEGDYIAGATVELQYEGETVASKTTNEKGEFTFAEVPFAVYKLVVTRETDDGEILFNTFNIELASDKLEKTLLLDTGKPEKATQVSASQALGQVTAEIDVDKSFVITSDETKGFKSTEFNDAKSLKLGLSVEKQNDEAANKAILDGAGSGAKELVLSMDLNLYKYKDDKMIRKLTGCLEPIEVIVAVPEAYQGKTERITLWYTHDGKTKEHGNYSFFNLAGVDYCKAYVNEFSTYALVYTAPYVASGDGLKPTITISTEYAEDESGLQSAGGTAEYDPAEHVLTVIPAEGFVIKDVIVNGQSKGAVTKLTDLYSWDSIEVVFESQASVNARITKGVRSTKLTITKIKAMKGKNYIKWVKSKGYKLDYYEVWRKTGNGKYKKFFTTSTPKKQYWNNKKIKKGTTYRYKVRGVRIINGKKVYTKFSNVKKVVAKG